MIMLPISLSPMLLKTKVIRKLSSTSMQLSSGMKTVKVRSVILRAVHAMDLIAMTVHPV